MNTRMEHFFGRCALYVYALNAGLVTVIKRVFSLASPVVFCDNGRCITSKGGTSARNGWGHSLFKAARRRATYTT